MGVLAEGESVHEGGQPSSQCLIAMRSDRGSRSLSGDWKGGGLVKLPDIRTFQKYRRLFSKKAGTLMCDSDAHSEETSRRAWRAGR